jgi:superfamily II DNA or RNA helicase
MTKRKGRKGEEWRDFHPKPPSTERIVLTPERSPIPTSRDKAQKEALNAWARKGFKGSIIAATGFGKSRIGVLAVGYSIDELVDKNANILDHNDLHKCLVLVPTTQLQAQFEEEFKKWGFEDYLEMIDIMCYQSAHKLRDEHYHVVLCDEIHLGLSPVYREFFEYNTYDKLLCMTATMPEEPEYRQILINLAPPVYKLSLDDAVEKGYVADYQIYCIGVKLTTVEKKEYDAYQSLFVRMKMALGYDAFTKAQSILSGYTPGNKGVAAQFMNAIRGRKKVVQHAGYKIDEAKVIIDHYKDDKVLTFGGSNAFADDIAEEVDGISYHSGKTPKKRENILECFRDGGCRILCTTKALNQGFNVPDVGIGIIVGLESKSLPLIQRVGRLLRKSEDKVGRVYILYVKDSQEETWLNKAVSKLKNVQRGEDLKLFLK